MLGFLRAKNLALGILRVVVVLVVIGLLGVGLDILLNLPTLPVGRGRIVGLAVLGLGVALEGLATLALWNLGRGTPNPADPPLKLVKGGPYRFSRNPLYMARVLILLGTSVFLESAGILVMAILLIIGVHFILLPREEKRLESRFGSEYLEYSSTVPRWVALGLSHHRRDLRAEEEKR